MDTTSSVKLHLYTSKPVMTGRKLSKVYQLADVSFSEQTEGRVTNEAKEASVTNIAGHFKVLEFV